MKIVHFITSSKPWLQSFNAETRLATAISGGAGLQELLQLWWDLFCRHVHPELSTEMVCTWISHTYMHSTECSVVRFGAENITTIIVVTRGVPA